MKIHRVYIKAENLTRDSHGSYHHDDSTILALKKSSRFSPCRSSPNCNRHLQEKYSSRWFQILFNVYPSI